MLSEGDDLHAEEFLLLHEEGHYDEVPEVDYKDSQFMLTPNLLKVRYGHDPVDWEEMKKYIEVRFVQKIIDYDHDTIETIPYKARLCDEVDYGHTEEEKNIFKANMRIHMQPICPDWDDVGKNKLMLKGTRGTHQQKRVEF